MKEIWKYIKGFDNKYSVSNLGRVKSENRQCFNSRYGKFFLKGKLLNPAKNNKGYMTVTLSKDGKIYSCLVHRLVAETFLQNVENKPQVNHINGIRTDNFVKNLEWCTQSENNLHSYKKLGRIKIGQKGQHSPFSKIVLQIKDGKIIAEFYGTCDAEWKTGIPHQSIGKVANGKLKTAGGYVWEWRKR